MEEIEKMKECTVDENTIRKLTELKIQLEECEQLICSLSSAKNAEIIRNHYANLTEDGCFNLPKMWGLKRKLDLKGSGNPSAKKDKSGNLITTKPALLQLYKSTYIDRLSPKEIQPNFTQLKKMKENLFEMRFEISQSRKSPDWTIGQIEKVCKTLKNGKARDESGLIFELFKPPYAGDDLYKSLTLMFKKIKTNLIIPNFLQKMSITSFYKNRGLKCDLSNDRGVFNVSKIRSILDRVIYSEVYPTIDSELSYSNVGGRKNRNIRDHLFVIYSIINDVVNGQAEAIEIQGYDITKCFDEMWFEETHNDLWNTNINDDKFALISKLDENCQAVVKTPCGDTDRFALRRIVLQGSVFGPIKCSVQVDTLGRDCLSRDVGLYRYKNVISVPPLAMIDDILGITRCNEEATELNSNVNVKIETKKLRLSHDKCYKIHISKKSLKARKCEIDLKVHDNVMKTASEAKYLGDVLNEEGNLNSTILERSQKGIGIVSQISSMLNSISLGFYYLEIALILREARLINGTLTNSEVWPSLNQDHLESLEAADIDLMRKIFNAHTKTASELFFLETGKIPFRFVIYKRRLMYLWHILTRNENELIHKVYSVQKLQTTKGDWFQIIQKTKEMFSIDKSDEEIKEMKKDAFKSYVDKKVDIGAFEHLQKLARKHSKSKYTWNQKKLEKQNYLNDIRFSKQDIQLLFALKSRMVNVKTNFRNLYNNNLECQTCNNNSCIEDENHILNCENLKTEESVKINFNQVYGYVEEQLRAVKIFKTVLRKREIILELKKQYDS